MYDAFVKVITTKMGITVGRFDFIDFVVELENRHVKGPTTHVIHDNGLVVDVIVDAIRQGGGGWFVDNPQYLEASNAPSVFGGLALGIIKICGHRNHCLSDCFTQIGFGIEFEFLQYHRRNFGDGIIAPGERHRHVTIIGGSQMIRHHHFVTLYRGIAQFAPHKAFGRKNRLLWVQYCLAFG